MNGQKSKPARLPLEIMMGRRTADNVLVDEFVVVKPGDPDYEHAYAYASRCYMLDGEPMPYAPGVADATPRATTTGDYTAPR